MAKTKVKDVEVSAPLVVKELLTLLLQMEKRLASQQSEINQHMEMIAEMQPKLRPDGTLSILAMREGEANQETVIVAARPLTENPTSPV